MTRTDPNLQVRGPHDEKFDEILEGLLDEYEALRKAGYTGNGFDADGQRLGGILGGSVEAGRKKALENLEERARKSRILGRGGRLGGSPAPIDPKQAAADVRYL